MKTLLVKIFKVSLIVLAVLLVVLLVIGVTLRLDWPWWMALFLLLILAAIGIGVLFLLKIMARKREQRFVQEVIEQDEARIKTLSDKERDEMKILQERWKETVEMLRRSHLRKQGNPLYVLPWYMVIGESNSGKTTTITSAKLASPFAEVRHVQGISGTKNCDWWFFEQAIIIDTAGRYAIPVDEGKDKDEWQRFLTLLLKYRKKEPLHGLIVTVAADKLLSAPREVLEEDGKSIRRRIDELMRVLGVKFPVYLLVTKCDLIQGMTQFTRQLPEKALDQPMGFINEDLSKDVDGFFTKALNTVSEHLKDIRLLLLHQKQSKGIDPLPLLFPEEFGQIRHGLLSFMKNAFQENPYQETPILRGIFFSSGRQEGTPYSHFLQAMGLIGEKDVLPGTSKGLFLHEFFANILPSDRRIFAPTTRAVEWQALTRNLGLTAWLLFAVALCGLLSFSFVKNLNSIKSVTRDLARPPVLVGQFLPDLVAMDRFRQVITRLETENDNWWIPRFGLRESIKVEKGLKEKFCRQFQGGFLGPFDRKTHEIMPRLITSTGVSDEIAGEYIVHLVRRINLLKARLDGVTLEILRQKPQPPYVTIMSEQTGSTEINNRFGTLYLSYILWREDAGEINKEIAILQAWLRELLAVRGTDFAWLITWVDKYSGIAPITLADFWGGTINLPDERRVNPAYTGKGKATIDAFLKEVETALPDPLMLEPQKAAFAKRYRTSAFETWQGFASYFPKGWGRLSGAREWQQTAARMALEQGPYINLINRITVELQPMTGGQETPPWVNQIYRLQAAKAQAYLKDQSAMAKAAEQGKKLVATMEKQIGREGEAQSIETQMAAGKAYQDFIVAVRTITATSASRKESYQLAAQAFTEEAVNSKSPYYAANGAALRLKANIGQGGSADDTVSRLLGGPIDFLWYVTRMEAACYLQSQWEEKVLAEAQGATGQQAVQLLLAPEGPVWKFVKGSGPAAPFIGWNTQKQYHAKEILGGSIPFDPGFFAFLGKGSKITVAAQTQGKPSYTNVTIRGLPTDSNSDAKVKPHATKLELQCSTGAQVLANYQYAVVSHFKWAPDTCGDVILKIEVGDTVLMKKYSGPQAFPDFLHDFRGGRKTFSGREFPGEEAALDRMGIKFITVNYQFSGEGQVTGQGRGGSLPSQALGVITRCWAK